MKNRNLLYRCFIRRLLYIHVYQQICRQTKHPQKLTLRDSSPLTDESLSLQLIPINSTTEVLHKDRHIRSFWISRAAAVQASSFLVGILGQGPFLGNGGVQQVSYIFFIIKSDEVKSMRIFCISGNNVAAIIGF